jgi:phage gp36-like protein
MAYCTLTDLKDQIREDDLAALTDDRTNLPSTTLAAEATISATTLTLTDSTAFPTSGRAEIGNEQIDYTGNAANILSGCTRAANGTIATAHANAATVTEVIKIDEDVIDRAIEDADSDINSYCSSQYDVPFATTPAIIRKISVDLAIYNLCSRRKGASDDRRRRRDDARAWLRDVAGGIVQIGDANAAADDDAGAESYLDTDDLIFTTGHTSKSTVGTLDNF